MKNSKILNNMDSLESAPLGNMEKYFKVSEVAKLLRTTTFTVLKYIREKSLKAFRISQRKILVPQSSLTKFLEEKAI